MKLTRAQAHCMLVLFVGVELRVGELEQIKILLYSVLLQVHPDKENAELTTQTLVVLNFYFNT